MSTKLTRRNLSKGALWAAPTVIASSSIPAYAASPKPTYKVSGSWTTYNYYQTGTCTNGNVKYTSVTFNTSDTVAGYAAGFAFKAADSTSPITSVSLSSFTLSVAYPAGIVQAMKVTGGAYTASGPVTQTINGVRSDVFTFTYTGTKTGSTIGYNALSPSWANSQLTTTTTINSTACLPVFNTYYVSANVNYSTGNGFSQNYNTGWLSANVK